MSLRNLSGLRRRVIASHIDRVIYEMNEWTLRAMLIDAIKEHTSYANLGPSEKWEFGWNLDESEKLHVILTQSHEQVEEAENQAKVKGGDSADRERDQREDQPKETCCGDSQNSH